MRSVPEAPEASGSTVTVKVTVRKSPVAKTPSLLSRLVSVEPSKFVLSVGRLPLATPVVSRVSDVWSTLTKAGPNCVARSSNKSIPFRSTVPVFSRTTSNVTSKLSPLATGLPMTDLAVDRSGIASGVGSSDVPLPLSLLGSVPLSLSSVVVIGAPVESVIGLPMSSTALPPVVA